MSDKLKRLRRKNTQFTNFSGGQPNETSESILGNTQDSLDIDSPLEEEEEDEAIVNHLSLTTIDLSVRLQYRRTV